MENTAKIEEGAPLLAEGSSPKKASYYAINEDARDIDSLLDDGIDNPHNTLIRPQSLRDDTIIVQDAENFIVPEVKTTGSASQESTGKQQNSFVTIFAIWNTMLGTSILAMPWAIQQAGLICGIVLMIAMAGLCLYTAYRVIQVQTLIGFDSLRAEYADVCRYLIGGWAEWLSTIVSICSLLGAAIVYWILMSNFLYNSVTFIANHVEGHYNSSDSSSNMNDVVCNIKLNSSKEYHEKELSPEWTPKLAPIYLILLVAPLISFKSPTFFTKFNALGIVSAIFVMCFTVIKAAKWKINVDFSNSNANSYIPYFQWSFPDLSGTLALSYFIHNCITSIMRNQRQPKNNGRDLFIAYCLVAVTYMVVGIMFYISFPLPKSCIADNLLNNLTNDDHLSFAARLFLLFQMLTVFPLLIYILRIQFFTQFFNMREPTLKYILPLNIVLLMIAVLIAIYYPHIGQMIRYTGAGCGLVYCFTLPCLTYMAALRRRGQLTPFTIVVHVIIIGIGVANVAAQFLMSNT